MSLAVESVSIGCRYLTFAALIAGVSGCGFLNRQTNAGLPESEMSTTALGAASGAVIGGGLGAIVGSTSGNAGEGVAIGAVAGAATGAGIGYQIERDERALGDHRKSLEVQQELIARQGEEISQLKQSTSDRSNSERAGSSRSGSDRLMTPELGTDITPGRAGAGRGVKGSSGAGRSSGDGVLDGYRGNPRAKPFGGSELSAVSRRPKSDFASTSRGRLKERDADLQLGSSAISKSRATDERPKFVSARSTVTDSSGSDSTTSDSIAASSEGVGKAMVALPPPTVMAKASGLPPARLDAPVVDDGATKDSVPTKAARSTKQPKDQGDCMQATKEAERGLNASSDADRIFYLRRAARLCPDEPAYHVELGKLYSEIGKHNDAKFEFRQAIDLDPDNQIARDELSILENSGGQ